MTNNNLKMFCITLEPSHQSIIKEMGYEPVGLGEKIFPEDAFHLFGFIFEAIVFFIAKLRDSRIDSFFFCNIFIITLFNLPAFFRK